MKVVPKNKAVYCFSPKNEPVERVKPGEKILLKLEDAFGGQVRNEDMLISKLDWSRVNGATGPIFVEGTSPGDTLAVRIEAITISSEGVIAVIPKHGILGSKPFKAEVKRVSIKDGFVHFKDDVKIRSKPMIGTIGVAPKTGEVPTGSLGRHGGNMDVKELTTGTTLYLPVFTEGALFAAGDLHAIQADGEACVSAVEVSGDVIVSFRVIKGKHPAWPILETRDGYSVLACGDSLDEASRLAVETVVEALMCERKWSFEEAYMLSSLVLDLKINQVVDPKKGVRAVISKKLVSIGSFLSRI